MGQVVNLRRVGYPPRAAGTHARWCRLRTGGQDAILPHNVGVVMTNPKVINVVLAGLGGQGVLTASDIVAVAAFRAGFDV